MFLVGLSSLIKAVLFSHLFHQQKFIQRRQHDVKNTLQQGKKHSHKEFYNLIEENESKTINNKKYNKL